MVLVLLLASVQGTLAQPSDAQVRTHMEAAAAAQARGDLKASVEEYRKAITLDPQHAEAHARLGMAHQNLGDLLRAAASLERALQLNPKLPRAGLLLAFSYLALGRNREAVPHLEAAFATDESRPCVWW